MTRHEAISAIKTQVEEYCKQAEHLFGVKLNPTIKFDLRGQTAGTAQTKRDGSQILRFNLTAINVEGGWQHLHDDTVPHEVAHLVQYNNSDWPKDRRANPPHGYYWKHVMSRFGVKADRCHSLPLPKARQQRKWKYACNCTTHEVSTTLHNKMRKGQSRICRSCRVRISYVGGASIAARQAL